MTMPDEMRGWDAVEIIARLDAGDITRREVIETAIERAEDIAHLGAVVTPTFDRALDTVGAASGPLAGVPTFIKDLAQVAGVRTGWGSRGTGTYVSRRDDPVVRRILATGLVSLGKSATPEFGMTGTTEPLIGPPCRNPWNADHSSGGSSGGAGTLVATGIVPIAHGSDGGGSIRIPASCCGLVGLKVSRHRLDMQGSNLLPVNIAVDGCLSRTVRDTVAFWKALETTRPPRRILPIGRVTGGSAEPLRIGVFTDAPIGTPVHEDNRRAALDGARRCEDLGHHVEEIPCPFDGLVIDDFLRYWGFVAWIQMIGAKVLVHPRFDSSKLEPWTRGLAGHFTSQRRAVAKSVVRLRGFARTYADVMARHDVLICPTTAAPPPELGYLATDLPFETAFARLREYLPFTPLQNIVGAPAISLPLGRSATGLPVGVQFAATAGGETTLLGLALGLEASAPWPAMAPV